MVVKNILFDMDGLLINSEFLSRQIFRELLAEQRREISDAQYREMIGKTLASGVAILETFFPDLDCRWLYDEYGRRYFIAVENGRLTAKPGAKELLEACRERGVRCAVASSNIREAVVGCLQKLGLYEYMDVIVHDGMGARGKPAPDLFLLAAERLGADKPQTLVLEDSYAGVMAAHAAGIPVIVIPDLIAPNAEMLSVAKACENTLFDIIPYLDA